MRNRFADAYLWFALFIIGCFLCGTLLLARGAFAQTVEAGRGLLCDTPEQARRFITLHQQDKATALVVVNAEANEVVCGMMQVAYIKGEEISREAQFLIVEIAVVGVNTPLGFRPIPPHKQYAIFPVKEERA